MGNKIKAVSYARVSTLQQADKNFSSVESQEQMIREFVLKHPEYELVEMFADRGRSAKNMNRPQIKKLISRIEQDDIRIVLSYRLDRISREKLSFYRFENLLKEHRVRLIYTNDINFEDNPSGNLAKGVMIAASQYERETTAMRIRDKYRESIKAGFHAGGYPPLGFVCGSKPQTIEIVPAEAILVQEIFSYYLRGERPCDIAKFMSEKYGRAPEKTSRKGKKYGMCAFTENCIRRILANPLYAGFVYFKDDNGKIQFFTGRHEPIITRQNWDTVQRRLALPKEKSSDEFTKIRSRKSYLLKKILFCQCGSNMTVGGSGKKRKDGSAYDYYVCTRKQHLRSECECDTAISRTIIEEIVFSAIGYFALRGVSISEVKKANSEYKKSLEAEQFSLRIKISKAEDDLLKTLDKFATLEGNCALQFAIEERLSKKSNEVESMKNRLMEVNTELSAFRDKLDLGHLQIMATIEDVGLCQNELTFEEKMEIITTSVKKLVLKVKARKAYKRWCELTIFPKNETERAIVVEFTVDNSKGRGLWEITAPFGMISDSMKNLPPKPSMKKKNHFLHKVVRWRKIREEENLTIRELGERIGAKKSMLCRQLKMLSALSDEAIEYILRLRYQRHTQKLGFRLLERISQEPRHIQLSLIKNTVK